MTLRLVVEHSPLRQPVTERSVVGGEITIGRGPDSDWRLEDPEQFISGRHCVIEGQGVDFTVVDTSRNGLFVDGEEAPLGAGRSRSLRDGMRLRMGEVVVRVELRGRESEPTQAAPAASSAFTDDDFFTVPSRAQAAPPPRPASLPTPFDTPRAQRFEPPARPAFDPYDDPKSLDPTLRPARPSGVADPFAGWSEQPLGDVDAVSRVVERSPRSVTDPFAGWDPPSTAAQTPGLGPEPLPVLEPGSAQNATTLLNDPIANSPEARVPSPPSARVVPPAKVAVGMPPGVSSMAPAEGLERVTSRAERNGLQSDAAAPPNPMPASDAHASVAEVRAHADLLGALLRGMGLDPRKVEPVGEAEMEAFGRQVRALVEGLMASMRSRAKERQSLRVAHTVISTTEVNPFKFMPSANEALQLMLGETRPGYMSPESAIAAARADLADHQVRSWLGLQAALRRMVARFDPAEIETEMNSTGRLGALLAGGRSALLWRLYQERFAEIAKAAEDRFLGEVGSDFRSAYEANGRESKGRVWDQGGDDE